MNNANIYKYIALIAAGLYIYKVAQKNGGQLAGNPEGIRAINPKIVDSILPWINIHPAAKMIIGTGAKKFIEGING